jgi:hypothetical protein
VDRKSLLLVTLFVEGGLYVFGLLLMGGSSALQSAFSLSWVATGYALLLCIPMFVILLISIRSSWEPLARLRNEMKEKIIPIFTNCNIGDLALIAFLAGFGEELFFRGWMQGALSNRMGIWAGILIASLIFGLAHYLSTTYAVYAFFTGIYLGVIYHLSGNLFIVMTMHALYDFVALVYLRQQGIENNTRMDPGE